MVIAKLAFAKSSIQKMQLQTAPKYLNLAIWPNATKHDHIFQLGADLLLMLPAKCFQLCKSVIKCWLFGMESSTANENALQYKLTQLDFTVQKPLQYFH